MLVLSVAFLVSCASTGISPEMEASIRADEARKFQQAQETREAQEQKDKDEENKKELKRLEKERVEKVKRQSFLDFQKNIQDLQILGVLQTNNKIVLQPDLNIIWQDNGANLKMQSWEQANDHCKALKLNDMSDWVLPTVADLKSLQTSKGYKNFKFLSNKTQQFWSDEEHQYALDMGIAVTYSDTSIAENIEASKAYTRCVHKDKGVYVFSSAAKVQNYLAGRFSIVRASKDKEGNDYQNFGFNDSLNIEKQRFFIQTKDQIKPFNIQSLKTNQKDFFATVKTTWKSLLRAFFEKEPIENYDHPILSGVTDLPRPTKGEFETWANFEKRSAKHKQAQTQELDRLITKHYDDKEKLAILVKYKQDTINLAEQIKYGNEAFKNIVSNIVIQASFRAVTGGYKFDLHQKYKPEEELAETFAIARRADIDKIPVTFKIDNVRSQVKDFYKNRRNDNLISKVIYASKQLESGLGEITDETYPYAGEKIEDTLPYYEIKTIEVSHIDKLVESYNEKRKEDKTLKMMPPYYEIESKDNENKTLKMMPPYYEIESKDNADKLYRYKGIIRKSKIDDALDNISVPEPANTQNNKSLSSAPVAKMALVKHKQNAKQSPTFKAKVVLESLRSQQTLQDIASKYNIASSELLEWQNVFLTNASLVFQDNKLQEPKELKASAIQELPKSSATTQAQPQEAQKVSAQNSLTNETNSPTEKVEETPTAIKTVQQDRSKYRAQLDKIEQWKATFLTASVETRENSAQGLHALEAFLQQDFAKDNQAYFQTITTHTPFVKTVASTYNVLARESYSYLWTEAPLTA